MQSVKILFYCKMKINTLLLLGFSLSTPAPAASATPATPATEETEKKKRGRKRKVETPAKDEEDKKLRQVDL